MDIIISLIISLADAIDSINPWVRAAFACAMIVMLIACCYGTKGVTVTDMDTGKPVPSRPHTPHQQLLWEERVAPYRDGVPHPNSPAHHYHTSPKHAYTDINMDDPDWARTLEDELS